VRPGTAAEQPPRQDGQQVAQAAVLLAAAEALPDPIDLDADVGHAARPHRPAPDCEDSIRGYVVPSFGLRNDRTPLSCVRRTAHCSPGWSPRNPGRDALTHTPRR